MSQIHGPPQGGSNAVTVTMMPATGVPSASIASVEVACIGPSSSPLTSCWSASTASASPPWKWSGWSGG